jgi:hypothetical protein
MPAKKKTNYISYELKKLENYLTQLNNTLDNNPPDQAVDRIELIQTARGGQMIKVIATKEQQLKAFLDILKELPKLLSEINTLRKEVDGRTKEVEVRGDQDRPGFMDNDDVVDEKNEEPPIQRGLPAARKTVEDLSDDDANEFDDASYWED